MKTRHLWLLAGGMAWTAGALVLACSSSSGGFGDDAGSDAPTMDATTHNETSTFDVQLPDQRQIQPDNTAPDSATDVGVADGTILDSGLVGHCSPVNGPACDLVKQNCPVGHECIIVQDPDAALGNTTACVKTTASEHLPVGSACCPNVASNQCDPGLTCIGDSCVDAGGGKVGGGGNCSPACCIASDAGPASNNCGTSPMGYLGQCGIEISIPPSPTLYNACTYSPKCIPFEIAPCGAGYECAVDDAGAGDCITIDGVDGGTTGAPPGAKCHFANFCEPDLECVGPPDGGTCLYECYLSGGTPPFDAAATTGAAGRGGCPGGYTCEGLTSGPDWLGVCVPP